MTPRLLLPLLASVAVLAGCGGSSPSTRSAASDRPVPAASSAATTGSVGGAIRSRPATAGSRPAASATVASPAGAAAARPTTETAAGPSTAAGTYTYDSTGTITAGTPQDASGTSTLTVDRPVGSTQHSVLTSDMGRTEQDVAARPAGRFLTRLVITNPAFTKEFRPPADALLVPDPAPVGRSWSWRATSTDRKTTASVTARVARVEVLTIGGQRTPTKVITSTLELSGDISYTARMETWYDAVHRLAAKEHTKGSGSYGGFAFSTDITSVLRSTRPS